MWTEIMNRDERSRAVFLDRDGTMIVDKGYISHPAQVKLLPGVPEALAVLQGMGFKLIVISNQSGIGRGMMTVRDVDRVNRRVYDLFSERGVLLTDFYYCPHRPEDRCGCRKPKSGLLFQAMKDYQIDAGPSFFAGDKWTDVLAAQGAGVRPVLLAAACESLGSRHHALTSDSLLGLPVIFTDSLLSWTSQLERGDII